MVFNMKKNKSRILSGVVAAVLAATTCSINAFASQDDIELVYDLKTYKEVIDENPQVTISSNYTSVDSSIDYIIKVSSSDLRFAYNLIEVAYYASSDKNIDINLLKNICNKPNIFHDKNEDGYYDVISALQKSIRGSDVNASLHYLARLINAGDLDIIIRRLSVIAYEDIGLANPSIGPKLDAVINAVLRLGLPEASIPLASIVIEMALSPKSNSAVLAINNALNDVISAHCGNVPEHIKTTSPNYKYPHDYPNHFVKQEYLPENIRNRKYYNPQNNINELKYKEVLKKIEDLRK